jgi:hypothetical protein
MLVIDEVVALMDGIGGTGEPPRTEPLLRRHRGHVVAQQGGRAPGLGDMPVQRMGLVLGQHDDLQVARVDEVGQREVDQAVDPAERHGRLGAIRGQGRQALALPAGKDDRHDLGGHLPTLTT